MLLCIYLFRAHDAVDDFIVQFDRLPRVTESLRAFLQTIKKKYHFFPLTVFSFKSSLYNHSLF